MVVINTPSPSSDLSALLLAPKANDGREQRHVRFGSTEDDGYVGPVHITTEGVAHGLGLVATRDIVAGECLFVTKPTVCATVQEVYREWRQVTSLVDEGDQATDRENDTTSLLEKVTEQVLVKSMKQALQQSQDDNVQRGIARSFLMLLGGEKSKKACGNGESSLATSMRTNNKSGDNSSKMEMLLGKSISREEREVTVPLDLSDDDVKLIIRRNAFGPDFGSYQAIESTWKTHLRELSSKENSDKIVEPTINDIIAEAGPLRLLGLYPFAAMINHACVANAVRVFSGADHSQDNSSYMVVHASTAIPKGTEVVWTYLPPTQPYPTRRQLLQTRHGFVCHCARCCSEASMAANSLWDLPPFLESYNQPGSKLLRQEDGNALIRDFAMLEEHIQTNPLLTNEARRYWRLGCLQLYVHYMNASLAELSSKPVHYSTDAQREALLKMASELHFCFVAYHMASTEHLSILHLCYELVGVLHTHASDSTKTMPKLRFWTEQLKRAHMIRYGSLGDDLQSVRAVMKHTQLVLRNQDGLKQANYEFI